LLLSKLATEIEVGLFSAACQVLHPISLIYRSIVSAVFPAMCKRAIAQTSDLIEITRWLVTFLVLISLPAVVLLIPFAGSLVSLLYGADNMQQAVPLVQIIAGNLVIRTTNAVFGHSLWAAGNERVVLRIVTLNLVANIIVGYFLIRAYGVWGAAYTSLLIATFNGAQHWYACKQLLRAHPLDMTVVTPLFASAMMCVPILMLYGSNQAVAAALAVLVYAASVGLIVLILQPRNLRDLPSRYFAPLVNS
jgi:O-antigen/teichoic acid export membrane protein